MPRLLDETGIEYVLHAGENIVGRDGADVILNSRTVSRRHAVLRVSDSGTVRVEDTNSTNGTRCGGVKVPPGQPVALSDGVIVQFGEVKLTAVLPPPPAKPDRAYPALPSPYDSVAGTPPPPLALMPPDPPVTSSGTIARLVGGDGTAFPLGDGATSFGRRAANTYVLSGDTYVSGAHAIVEQDNGRFYLVDLGSTNGTRLNGRRIAPNHPEPLSDGDEVLLGQTPFTFRFPGH
jgi:pSer/pThr/pTyr-binding forkhead associated (FHA) protein